MAKKLAPATTLCLSKEIRIGNEAAAGSTIQICVPSTGVTAPFTRNPRPQRHIFNSVPILKDDQSFSRSVLANSGSIHFGTAERYPQSIIWRILGDRSTLELRSADLSKSDQETREATYVVQLVLPSTIRDRGVALADAEDDDFLCLFVLTKGSDLYTFTIRRDIFCHASASEEGVSNWSKIFKPASFSISTPYRLIAATSQQLVVSLSDGRLLNLTRRPEDDGSFWREITYSDGLWGASLRGLVRWQGSNTFKLDGASLEQDTATALALSPDRTHAFAVCLNHTLKVWNLEMARSVFSTDLLGQKRDPSEIQKVMLDPGMLHKVHVFRDELNVNGDLYYVMAFSPHDLGQFKIWSVRDPDEGGLGIRDLFPELTLRPPDPDPSPDSKAIWEVADFTINGAGKGRASEIWILMRSNKHYRLYKLKFNVQNLASCWRDDWTMTVLQALDQHIEPQIQGDGPEDARELWLSFFLHPGRYPETVLETALSMYSLARQLDYSPKSKATLKERMCSVIASSIRLHHDDAGETDFKRFRADIHQEWIMFWQDVRDLNNSRWEVFSLAYAEKANMPWIVFADGYAAIRECSRIEILAYNKPADLSNSLHFLEAPSIEIDDDDREPKLPDELALVIEAASAFRQSFSYSLHQLFNKILTTELWRDPLHSVPVRMQSFYDRCNFAEEVTEICVVNLETGLQSVGGVSGLETQSFLAIINEIPQLMSTDASDLSSSKFGLKVLIEGARDMIDLHERLLLDLLALVVFINAEIDMDEISMHNFDSAQIFVKLLDLLRQCQMMQWLAKKTLAEKDDARAELWTGSSVSRSTSTKGNISTVLETLFAHDTKPQAYGQQSQCTALTRSIQDILKWAMGGNDHTVTLDHVLVYVQCNLLANNNIELASEFLRYQPSTAWATYIRGRLCLLRREYTEAALYFQKSAFKLCKLSQSALEFDLVLLTSVLLSGCSAPGFNYHTASHGFLSPLEAAHFGHGLPSYYRHILILFQSSQCHSYVASFAHISLQLTALTNRDQVTPLLLSLFQASLATQDFPTAYSTLIRHPDPITLLPSLINSMLSNYETAQFLSFPFPPSLHPTVDAFLLRRARSLSLEPHATPETPKYYEILSTWRLGHNDFRGAAAALLERLHRLRKSSSKLWTGGPDGECLLEGYLSVINLLACAGEGWVLSGGEDEGEMWTVGKRKVVTIKDIRNEYQNELDRRGVVENGRFGFGYATGGEDEMDVL